LGIFKGTLPLFGTYSPPSSFIYQLGLFKSEGHRTPAVLFDADLQFDKHINSVFRGGFFQLRNIAK